MSAIINALKKASRRNDYMLAMTRMAKLEYGRDWQYALNQLLDGKKP